MSNILSKKAKIKTDKQNVKLRTKKLANGELSLYLDFYRSGVRKFEFLKLSVKPNPRTPQERAHNNANLEFAEKVRTLRETEFVNNEFGFVPPHKQRIDFLTFYQEYIDSYTKKDSRMLKCSFDQFKEYLEKSGFKLKKGLQPNEVDKLLITGFKSFLEDKYRSPASYFKRFKKVLNNATDKEVFRVNPAKGITITDKNTLTKDILSSNEIQILAKTYCGNEDVKRAFLFCCFTGLRWCDVRVLKFKNINFANKTMKFTQIKTEHSSKSATVIMDLNQTALKMIGDAKEPDEIIFNLPSDNGALKSLRLWTKKAGINKHITWHCARHSFAVMLLGECKTDIKTLSSLLGHAGLKHTEVYTHVVDELKSKAINGLKEIEI
jgi:integrase/recombinase XerD